MKLKKNIAENWLIHMVFLALAVFVIEYWNQVREVIHYFLRLLSPFILGGCIAFVANLPMKCIENKLFVNPATGKRKKGARSLSLIITIFLFLGIIAMILFMILPELIRTVGELINNITRYSMKQNGVFTELWKKYPQLQTWLGEVEIDWKVVLERIWEFAKAGISGVLTSTIDMVGAVVFKIANFCIGCVFAIYLLYNKEILASQGRQVLYSCMKSERVERILYILSLTNETFSNFLSGQCVEACILGFMFFLTMSLLGLPYPLLMGVVIAVTALVPVFGSFVGLALGVLLILAISPMDAVVFVVLFFILQQLEENLIYPHVVGNSVGLPSIWVMVAVTLGGSLMGVVGMLLFLPLASVWYRLFREKVKKRNQRRD